MMLIIFKTKNLYNRIIIYFNHYFWRTFTQFCRILIHTNLFLFDKDEMSFLLNITSVSDLEIFFEHLAQFWRK